MFPLDFLVYSYFCFTTCYCLSLSHSTSLFGYWLVSLRSSSWPGVMTLSGSWLGSPGGPQRQMACQGVVTEVDCLPQSQPYRHQSHLSNQGLFGPPLKSPTHPCLTDCPTALALRRTHLTPFKTTGTDI